MSERKLPPAAQSIRERIERVLIPGRAAKPGPNTTGTGVEGGLQPPPRLFSPGASGLPNDPGAMQLAPTVYDASGAAVPVLARFGVQRGWTYNPISNPLGDRETMRWGA